MRRLSIAVGFLACLAAWAPGAASAQLFRPRQDCSNGQCATPTYNLAPLAPAKAWHELLGYPGFQGYGAFDPQGRLVVEWHWCPGMPQPAPGLPGSQPAAREASPNYGLDLGGMHSQPQGTLMTRDNAFAAELRASMGANAPKVITPDSLLLPKHLQEHKKQGAPLIESGPAESPPPDGGLIGREVPLPTAEVTPPPLDLRWLAFPVACVLFGGLILFGAKRSTQVRTPQPRRAVA